jgi:hypothetical protein
MNKLNKICVALLICLIPVLAHAQKCKLDIDETDAFTKEHVKAGTSHVGGMMWHWKLTLKQTANNKYGWEMQIKYGTHLQDAMGPNDVVYCKLENGKVIKLVCDRIYEPSHVVGSGVIITSYLPKGNLDAGEMKDFSESPLSEMRVVLSGKTLEPNISGKQGSAIQDIARCILKD